MMEVLLGGSLFLVGDCFSLAKIIYIYIYVYIRVCFVCLCCVWAWRPANASRSTWFESGTRGTNFMGPRALLGCTLCGCGPSGDRMFQSIPFAMCQNELDPFLGFRVWK